MITVGVLGLGMMGMTHLDVYAKHPRAKILAVADRDESRRTGKAKAAGNIEGQAQGAFDFDTVGQYIEAAALIANPDVDLIDVCLPTPQHLKYAKLAIEAGKHVLIEKPLARTSSEAEELVAAASKSSGQVMCAMCMRFWPGWTWLKDTVDHGKYGSVKSATFRRVADHPGGQFYKDGDACGGAILDLHIHDTDFIQYVFGMPEAVTSRGYQHITNQIDHVVTQYHYPNIPVVVAEGGWAMSKGFGFEMQYAVNFERATAVFNLAAESPLTLFEPGHPPLAIPLIDGMGYDHEIDYFLDCITQNQCPERVTLESAAKSVRIVEAEIQSVLKQSTVEIG